MSAATDKLFSALRRWASTFFTIRNVLTFSLFMLVATGLWLGHAMNTTRERTLTIPVGYEGIPAEYSFITPLPDHINVRLRDVGQRLRAYSDIESKTLVFDMTEQVRLSTGELHLSADQIRPRISDLLQGTTRLQEIMPESATATYVINKQKLVSVKFDGELSPAKQYELAMPLVIRPEIVNIYGPEDFIDTITSLTTKNIVVSDIKDTLTMLVPLEQIDNVRAEPSEVEITVVAEQFTEKVLTVPLQTRRVPDGQVMRLFPAAVEVRVKVAMKDYNSLNNTSLEAYCNYMAQTNNRKLDVHVESKTDKIQIVRINPTTVEYIVEQQ